MQFLQPRKNHIIGISCLVILFVLSILIRKKDLSAELGRDHEWITAHSLVTMEIWDENGGPSEFGFNPVYSYPDTYNFSRGSMGGVSDQDGLHYYVSYPPFVFLFGYYATQIIGGPDLKNIRILNLFIHLICSLFIYLIFAEIMSRSGSYHFNIAGLIAAAFYIFIEGFLWIHGMLYFVDSLEQMWILICAFIVLRFFRQHNRPLLFYCLLFLAFFVAVYTEWLAVFFSFFTGIGFLTIYFIRKKKKFLYAFILIGTASLLAIGLTLMQYTSIAGWEDLSAYWEFKFSERSGHVTSDPQFGLNIKNDETFRLLEMGINKYFKIAQNIFGAVSIVFLLTLIVPVTRKRMRLPKEALFTLSLLFLSVLTHYIIFFNFNALHFFSSVKTGMILVLISGLFIHLMISSINNKKVMIVFSVALISYSTFKLVQSVQHYNERTDLALMDMESIHSAQIINQNDIEQLPVFTNLPFHPKYLYYAKRDMYFVRDTTELGNYMKVAKLKNAQFFIHKNLTLKKMLICHFENGQLDITDQKEF